MNSIHQSYSDYTGHEGQKYAELTRPQIAAVWFTFAANARYRYEGKNKIESRKWRETSHVNTSRKTIRGQDANHDGTREGRQDDHRLQNRPVCQLT